MSYLQINRMSPLRSLPFFHDFFISQKSPVFTGLPRLTCFTIFTMLFNGHMKNILCIPLLLLAFSLPAQQKETFDLATYIVPAGWKKLNNTIGVIGYAITNDQTGTYCQLALYMSTNSKGSLQADFESEWQELVVKSYKPTEKPEPVPTAPENGWEAQGGVAPFEFSGGRSIAMLATMSGYGRCMSIVVLTNTGDYQVEIENFFASVELSKPETVSQPVTDQNHDMSSIIATWELSTSDQSSWRVNNGVMSTISRQYTFNENGTYTFIIKTFDPLMDKLLLTRENGTYQISGNNLTVNPQKSVIEAWSKKNGTDHWGSLLTTQNNPLEKTAYQFFNHYNAVFSERQLILKLDNPTQRDGPFNGGAAFNNAWIYHITSPARPIIKLPGE